MVGDRVGDKVDLPSWGLKGEGPSDPGLDLAGLQHLGRVVGDDGGWWRVVENGGGWWRMVEDCKG